MPEYTVHWYGTVGGTDTVSADTAEEAANVFRARGFPVDFEVEEWDVDYVEDQVLFPDITVQITGEDGNAFAIIGRVTEALKRGGADPVSIATFRSEAMSGDYDNLLRTVQAWVNAR